MQSYLALFLLGLIQGLTEFLPVSSSGHLVLFSKIFGIEESLFLSIILHVATLFSIVVVFYKDVWNLIRHPFSKETMQLAVATIPTCIIVLILMPVIKQSFAGGLLPICFASTAVVLWISEMLSSKKIGNKLDYKGQIFMGVAQGLAVFPGISRSGATISAGLLAGRNKSEVAKFSFIMSLPIIILSLVMEIFDISTTGIDLDFGTGPIILSFLTAFIVGIVALKVVLKLTEKSNLKWFSFYLILISIVSLFVL